MNLAINFWALLKLLVIQTAALQQNLACRPMNKTYEILMRTDKQ